MSYQTLVDDFKSILNRDDCTDAQADAFLRQGILRIQRKARLPCMERELDVAVLADGTSIIPLPADLLQIIDVFVQDGYSTYAPALQKVDYRDILALPSTGQPRAYARYRSVLKVSGGTATGDLISLFYYGAFTPLADWTEDNEVTAGFSEVALYAGLSLAADSFAHPSGAAWEERYQSLLNDLVGEAIDIEMNGGPMGVQPMYVEDYS